MTNIRGTTLVLLFCGVAAPFLGVSAELMLRQSLFSSSLVFSASLLGTVRALLLETRAIYGELGVVWFLTPYSYGLFEILRG